MNRTVKWIGGVALGAALGFAYYRFIGCASGTCAITSNPVNSTLYGAMMGFLMGWPSRKKSENPEKDIE